MSRRFRSDDTSIWSEKYGPGTAGAATISGTYGVSSQGSYAVGPCSGSSGAYTLTTPSGWGSNVYYVFIHQTQGTGAGNYELNVILSISGTTSTLLYPLQNTYGTGAQVTLMVPYSGITISGTLAAPAWNGSAGGIIALLCSDTTNISGSVTATGKGFRGGNSQPYQGFQGESAIGLGGGDRDYDYVRNGAGGGGGSGNNHETDEKPHGNAGGGGNGSVGQIGYDAYAALGGRYTPEGGTTDGNAGLTDMVFGGGGGGSANIGTYWGTTDGMAGETGGGIIFIISKTINVTGYIYCNGDGQATRIDSRMGYGGGGAGGSILIKSQTASWTNGHLTATGGVTAGTNGDGGVGRIHIDYLLPPSGTTSPTIDSRQDFSLRTRTSTGGIIV